VTTTGLSAEIVAFLAAEADRGFDRTRRWPGVTGLLPAR
jgi:hypothetical protein